MTFYCNDCGEGYPAGDDIRQQTVRCQKCLHDSGDCWNKDWPCEFCKWEHRDNGHDSDFSYRYCRECVVRGFDHPRGKQYAKAL